MDAFRAHGVPHHRTVWALGGSRTSGAVRKLFLSGRETVAQCFARSRGIRALLVEFTIRESGYPAAIRVCTPIGSTVPKALQHCVAAASPVCPALADGRGRVLYRLEQSAFKLQ